MFTKKNCRFVQLKNLVHVISYDAKASVQRDVYSAFLALHAVRGTVDGVEAWPRSGRAGGGLGRAGEGVVGQRAVQTEGRQGHGRYRMHPQSARAV
jgi:hypothetical protein